MVIINRKKYTSFRELHERDMKDPEYRRMYEANQPRLAILRELIRLRAEKKLTQKQMAKKMGTYQSAIARFESGTYNPSFKFVQDFAFALGKKVVITG